MNPLRPSALTDRWMSLAEVAKLEGRAPSTLARIAREQSLVSERLAGTAKNVWLSLRTLAKWPAFSRDPSGKWGIRESEYLAWRRRRELDRPPQLLRRRA